MWYTSNLCKSYIRRPYFTQSYKPEVGSITSSAVTVSWQQAKNIPTGLETHYYYVVWLQKGEHTLNSFSRISQTTGLSRLQSHIDGLAFNTNYSIKIEAYRQQNETEDRGHSTRLRRFKTSCTAPDVPSIQHLTASTHDGSLGVSLIVTWKVWSD
ncbi:hypothetical protein LSAT2_030317 [Lamellibrachia satsuma]|nr:hypothetical protein LSAT2_030317 [Lamellibrachia satsuma]